MFTALCLHTRWLAGLPGKEHIGTQTMACLLTAVVLKPGAAQARVKRLFAMRHALRLVDVTHPSADALRATLQQASICPSILAITEV